MPAEYHRVWTPDEDRKLLEMIESGKSWVLISPVLKRSERSIRVRARALKRLSEDTDE